MPRILSFEDMEEKLDDEGIFYLLIDLSPADHYAREHLPNSINLPQGRDLENHLRRLAPDKETLIVVYASQKDSPLAWHSADRIESLGYPEVFVLEKDEQAWKREHRPLEPDRML